MNEERPLIAVAVKSIGRDFYPGMLGGHPHNAIIVGRSTNRDASFEFQTGFLSGIAFAKCQQLEKHGFTAVEAPENWRYGYYNEPGGWQHALATEPSDDELLTALDALYLRGMITESLFAGARQQPVP
ncbi:hypothetical protein [Granulicella tundricola]|uniref:hypothetical protein n=1 Tax=Granulicella tundricola TaxID=940615 RepID=UPI0005A28A3E|nr:hypothetical protein [Granulicella tundricola]